MDKQINDKFIEAVKNSNLKLIKEYLVEKGANIHADDDYALRYSARYGHFQVVKYLVENGANIHANDDLALHWSAECGHIEVVKFLVLISILRNKPIKYNNEIIFNYIHFLNKKARIIQR